MDRKALKREYKEAPRPMGVYRVKDSVNGKSLVGPSADLPSILNRLRMQLRMGSPRIVRFRRKGDRAFHPAGSRRL